MMRVGVIGSGSIGPDLAYGFLSQLADQGESRVYLVDVKAEALAQGQKRIQSYIEKGVARGKLNEKKAKTLLDGLVPTQELSALKDASYVLEAASEDLNIKKSILRDLENVVTPDCLIGFATSGIPRARIIEGARHPERCFVNHPFYPAWRSLPIEVVLSGHKDFEDRMLRTLKQLGKVPIVTRDVPSFAADDIFCNYICEAVRIFDEGIANIAQIDRIVNDAIGGGGPFAVMDATRGNLLTVKCQRLMLEAHPNTTWFAPPERLAQQGNNAWYATKSNGTDTYEEALKTRVLDRILAVLLGRSLCVVNDKTCEPSDLNWLTRSALGFRRGLLEIAEELGADRVAELCKNYQTQFKTFPVPTKVSRDSLNANIRVERQEDVGIIRVFRPEVRNALSVRTIQEIDRALDQLLADNNVKGIVFTSYDGALAGADINELAALPSPAACREICLKTHPVLRKMENAQKPVVAALDGPVMGGGAEFSMACHARVIGPKLLMSQPEVNLGIIPGYGGTQRLPRIIGIHHAQRLLRTGAAVIAKEAAQLGWATLGPVEDPEKEAIALVRRYVQSGIPRLSQKPMDVPAQLESVDIGHRSLAIDHILVDVLRRGLSQDLAKGLEVEADGFARCKETVDLDIGMKNFIQNGPRVPAAFLHE